MENYSGSSSSSSSSGIGAGGQGSKSNRRPQSGISGGMGGMTGGERSRHEDPVTSKIEHATAQVPSVTFLGVAIGAMAGSLGFFLAGKKDVGLLIATWVPTVLILGNYNKIVKALENIETGGLRSESHGGGSGTYSGSSAF